MKKSFKKVLSVIMAMIFALSCASVAFADSQNYTYVCNKCGETVEVISGIDTHSMFCDKVVCEYCGKSFSAILIGAHQVTCALTKYTVEIKNNPGEVTLNYGDTLKLYGVVLFDGVPMDIDGAMSAGIYQWTTDSSAVELTTYGEVCEVKAVKSGTAKITFSLVDEYGDRLFDSADSQTINVKAGFFQKLISFFKDLFGMDRTVVQ